MSNTYLKQIIKEVFLEVAKELKITKVPEGDWTKAEFATDEKPVYALKESPEELNAPDNMYMLEEEVNEYTQYFRDQLLEKIREAYSQMKDPEDSLDEPYIISSISDDFISSENPNYSEMIASKILPLLGLSEEQTKEVIEKQDIIYIKFLEALERVVVDHITAEFDDAKETVDSDSDNDYYPSDTEIFGTPKKLHRGY